MCNVAISVLINVTFLRTPVKDICYLFCMVDNCFLIYESSFRIKCICIFIVLGAKQTSNFCNCDLAIVLSCIISKLLY